MTGTNHLQFNKTGSADGAHVNVTVAGEVDASNGDQLTVAVTSASQLELTGLLNFLSSPSVDDVYSKAA